MARIDEFTGVSSMGAVELPIGQRARGKLKVRAGQRRRAGGAVMSLVGEDAGRPYSTVEEEVPASEAGEGPPEPSEPANQDTSTNPTNPVTPGNPANEGRVEVYVTQAVVEALSKGLSVVLEGVTLHPKGTLTQRPVVESQAAGSAPSAESVLGSMSVPLDEGLSGGGINLHAAQPPPPGDLSGRVNDAFRRQVGNSFRQQ